MANNCWYQMRIAGKKESVDQFIAMLSGEAPIRLGRVFSVNTDEQFTPFPGNRGIGYADVSGDCAWSIRESMLPGSNPSVTLATEAKRLGLVIEGYSSEPGLCFQEHVLINKGDILTFDCVDYEEYFIEDMNEKQLAELCAEKGLTKEEILSNANHNGDYTVGGFGEDFADYKDLSVYFPPARNLSLDQVLGIIDEEIHASELLGGTDKNNKQREARATKIKTLRFISDLLQHRAEQYAAIAVKTAPVIETDKSIPMPSADLQQQKDGTVRLWARVGMTLDVSPETYTRLKAGDKNILTAVLQGKEGKAFLNGETYFPDIEENKGLEDMEFDLFAAIHSQPALDMQPSRSTLDAQIKDAQSRTTQDKSNNEKEPER